MSDKIKKLILGTASDCVVEFLDRSDDEDLPNCAIETAIEDGVITVDEIAAAFKAKLVEML